MSKKSGAVFNFSFAILILAGSWSAMVVLYLCGLLAAWIFGKSKKPDPDE